MLVCLSCNIEFKEDKKFCSYCRGSLVTKEDVAPNKKSPEKQEEKSEQKLICPHCKTIYEFGSSCIECGSDLVAEIPSDEKEVLEADGKRPEGDKEGLQSEEPRKVEVNHREGLICPNCNIAYKEGNFCPKCGSPLLPQALSRASEKAKVDFKPEAAEEPISLQTIQEQLIETPRKNLICPYCKIIYERGSTCVRCGSGLVAEVAGQEVGMPELLNPPEADSRPNTQDETTDRLQTSEPKIPASSSPKTPEGGPVGGRMQRHTEHFEREELELFSDIETDKTSGASKQDSEAKSADPLERRSFHPRKSKINYRRSFLEVGSISIIALAAGYLLWSVYLHVTKVPELQAPLTKEVFVPPRSGSPNATATISAPESEMAEPEPRSTVSNEKTEAVPSSHSALSEASTGEALEIGKIKGLFETIRQANLQKDVDLFMSCYAMDYKDREGKRKATLSFWKKFDYLELSYDLKNSSITGDTAKVRIEWVIKIAPKGGREQQESKTFFDAVLKKEEGSWKIQEVKQAG